MSCSVFIFQPCSNSGNPCAFSVFYILDLHCILGQSESDLTYTGFSLLLLGEKKVLLRADMFSMCPFKI
jgi:hypothetical protein